MPMMRRGPLDRYSPEWVLRQANAHQAEGSIEFHTDRPVTIFLQGGRAYAAEEGVDLQDQSFAKGPLPTESEARARTVQLLTGVMAATAGWYFHDPLGQHPCRGSWAWETATLLMDTRSKTHETTSLATWSARTVTLQETRAGSVTIGADAWALVVNLARSAGADELRTELGWTPDRVANALAELDACGVLQPTPPGPPRPPSESSTTAGAHHTGPLSPPPVIDAPAPRRRVLPLRRTTGS